MLNEQQQKTLAGLTLEDFKAWLASVPPDTTFERCDSQLCPVARFLQTSLNNPDISCGATIFAIQDLGEHIKMPGFLSNLVYHFDSNLTSLKVGVDKVREVFGEFQRVK